MNSIVKLVNQNTDDWEKKPSQHEIIQEKNYFVVIKFASKKKERKAVTAMPISTEGD